MRQKGGREDRGHTAPTNNLDLRIKAEPVTDGADATVYCISVFWARYTYIQYAQKPDTREYVYGIDSVFLRILRLLWHNAGGEGRKGDWKRLEAGRMETH